MTIKSSNENHLEDENKSNQMTSDQLLINLKNVKSLEKHLSSSVSSSSSSSSSSKSSNHSSSHSSATNLNKTKSNRIKKTTNNKRKIKNEYNSALASLNPSIQRGKIASNRVNLQQHIQPHSQTIININASVNNIINIDQENRHLINNNNNEDENDTDILDESDSDLETNLNKISTGNSGISDEDEESSLGFNNSSILINQQQQQQRFYQQQQQQQQQIFQQYNIYNDQENDPIKSALKQPKQNRHKNVKVNKVKTNRNNLVNSNVDSVRSLKIKIKKNNLKENKLTINNLNDELNNSEDEYDQRPLRQSIGLNQNVNSDQHHVKHTGNLNENHDSFITAETIEEVKRI